MVDERICKVGATATPLNLGTYNDVLQQIL